MISVLIVATVEIYGNHTTHPMCGVGGCWIYIATVTIQYKATRLWLITILKYMILMDPFLMLAFLMSHFLIPARSRSGRRITDAEAGPKVCEQLHRKTLGHDIRELVHRGNMEDANLAQGQLSIDPNGSFPNTRLQS